MYVVTHQNVDLDAVVSAYIARLIWNNAERVVTLDKIDSIPDGSQIIVLDTPIDRSLEKKIKEKNLILIAHHDHHTKAFADYPSTASILYKEYRKQLPEWVKYLAEAASASDSGDIFKVENAGIKLFHLSGYITAMRTRGYSDEAIIDEIFRIIDTYSLFLQSIAEAEKEVRAEIAKAGDYLVAKVDRMSSHSSFFLFSVKGVHFIVGRDGNNIMVMRNAILDKPNLSELKPEIEKKVGEEIKEWFFHPKGFIACRGTRKHPVNTPSKITLNELFEIVRRWLDERTHI